MAENKVIVGDQVFRNNSILGGNCFIGNSIAGDELTVDTLDVKVDTSEQVPTLFCPSDADGLLTVEDELFGVRPWIRLLVTDPAQFTYGQQVEYHRDGKLFAVFYMASVKRAGKYTYEISCTSAIGLLDNATHYGGLYTGQPMPEVLADLVGGLVAYTVDPLFDAVSVYGWLPVGTRRENLHQLLFAVGASVKKNGDGTLYFTVLDDSAPAALEEDRLFLGGSVDYQTPATSVAVTEHAYTAFEADKEATLFEGEAAAEPITTPKGAAVSGVLVTFRGPMHDLTIDNGEILESGVNYAVIAQSSGCKLVGKEYTHTTRIITRGGAKVRGMVDRKDNEVTVTNATLVSLANSENVADRVLAYYGSARTVTNDLIVGEERPGDAVRFTDPFDTPAEGFVKSMDISMGGLLRASAQLVAGYVPTEPGNYYTHFVVLDRDQTWTVPTECKGKIRAVLIGGGQGGFSGAKGEDGGRASGSSYGTSGKGGQGGDGGSGGKVYIVTVPTAPGQRFAVAIGAGGIGGVMGEDGVPTPGNEGGATTFGSYTSLDGRPSDTGHANQMTGEQYALPGSAGIAGGAGQPINGEGETVEYKGVTYTTGQKGAEDSIYGLAGNGGLGGGAAAGANGKNGDDANAEKNNGHGFVNGGDGGAGAAGATGDTAAGFGMGGHGGHGGGGGGGGGGVSGNQQYIWPGGGGPGGTGGQGGKGTPGCVIVYW